MTALEARVAKRKQNLIAEIIEHKKNSSRLGAADAIAGLKARLSDLDRIVKKGVVGGWARVGERAQRRLDAWTAR